MRVHYGWTLSADWPRFAMVRALNQQAIYADPVVYDWPHVKARTLVIGGEKDGPNFPELARHVADTIPNAELVLFDNVGHNPHLKAPERFFPQLVRFLKSDLTGRRDGLVQVFGDISISPLVTSKIASGMSTHGFLDRHFSLYTMSIARPAARSSVVVSGGRVRL